VWPDESDLDRAIKQIGTYPPLVFAGEARALQASLARVAAGNAFLLQAGDCAESFDDFSAVSIREKLQVILQMAVVLTYSIGVPVVKVGRIAGQFAKPRTSATELVDGTELPSFRAHRQRQARPPQRVPDPERLVQATTSRRRRNLLRAFTRAASRTCPGSRMDAGSWPAAAGSASRRSPTRSTGPCASCGPAGSTRSRRRSTGRRIHEPRGAAHRLRGH
jgi:3-deoxy-D-arabino-heptulosonate 7-phosphate (DAHP) synthase class II